MADEPCLEAAQRISIEHTGRRLRLKSETYSRNLWVRVLGLGLNCLTPSQPGRELQPGMLSSVGDPTKSKMICA